MKKSFFNLRPAMLKGVTMIAAMALTLASCSENDAPALDNGEDQTNAGVSVNVVNDPSILSQYVTNYKAPGKQVSRSGEETTWTFSMPALPESTEGMTAVVCPDWKWGSLDGADNWYVPEGETLDFKGGGLGANNQCNLYIYGTLIVPSFAPAQGANIYIAPGGKLVLTGTQWNGTRNGVLTNDTPTNLYIYKGGEYEGSLTTASKTGLYVEGDLKTGDVEFGGTVYIYGTLTADNLTTNNSTFRAGHVVADTWTYKNDSDVMVSEDIVIVGDVTINAQNVSIKCQNYLVGGKMHMENNSVLYAYEHLGVNGEMEVSTQGIVYTPCLYVADKLYIKNSATLNIPNYIYCDSFEASASGFAINMGGKALFNANKEFTIQNKGWSIAFDNDENSYSAIVADKFEIMEGQAAYISGYAMLSAEQYWGKPSENKKYYVEGDDYASYNVQETVKVTFGGVTIKSDAKDCTPEFTTPESKTPPTITEIITSIAHTHDISATCVAINNGKAYFSWHKRGTSIHGCLEAGAFSADDQFALTSWMEVDDDDTEGGNNWDGNSAVSGADEAGEHQGQYDFNHLIVAEGKVVTVGDNAKKGGFIGAIALDAAGDFGMNGTVQDAFKTRQLLGNVTDKIGRSGNAVAWDGNKYYIACAGGFQEYNGSIDNLFVNKNGAYELTAGSAKHIAFNPAGDKVATLELTAKGSHVDGDDYWFNDTETAISAVLKVREANNWLNTSEWQVNIGNICPIYGKNAIAMDANGNVYVSAGKQGLLVYNNGTKVGEFSIAAEEPKAGANGVAIDDKYVYVAYGIGGVYILNKSDLSVVSWYKSNAPEGYTTQAAAAAANYIALDGKYIYVAYGRHGIKILKLND